MFFVQNLKLVQLPSKQFSSQKTSFPSVFSRKTSKKFFDPWYRYRRFWRVSPLARPVSPAINIGNPYYISFAENTPKLFYFSQNHEISKQAKFHCYILEQELIHVQIILICVWIFLFCRLCTKSSFTLPFIIFAIWFSLFLSIYFLITNSKTLQYPPRTQEWVTLKNTVYKLK